MKRNTIDIITLGCSKNLVDSEKLMRQLEANGYKVTHDSDKPQGEIAVINTCGFIGDAKEESINMILEFCQAKEEGKGFGECLDAMNEAAEKGWQSTKDLVARIGRASRLGERSRGVLDAGATSCYFIITTIGKGAKSLL